MGLPFGGFVTNISSIAREGVGLAQHFPTAVPTRTTAAPANLNGAQRPDQVQLQSPVNPYEGFADQTRRVSVDRWKQGPNDSIEHMLLRQGYSPQEVYRKDANGRTLIQRVAQVNGLKDPNLVRPGRKMLVPVKGEGAATPRQTTAQVTPQVARQTAQTPTVRPEVVQPPTIQPAPVQATPVQPETAPTETAPAQTAPPTQTEQATETTAPAEPVKKGRRRFILFGPRRQPKPPEVAPQQPTQTATIPQTQTTVPTPTPQVNETDKDSAEVGLLLDGVKGQKFTRPEFQALNSTANQFTELRARYARDGFKPEQVQELAQVQQQYGQMYARFLADDKARVTFAGANTNTPEAQFRARQNEEGGQAYDQFVSRQIDEAAVRARLLNQRQQASQLGADQR